MEVSIATLQIWLPLVIAALVQASFGLGVSMLTLLSGHLLSDERSAARLHKLTVSYILGFGLAVFTSMIASLYILSFFDFTSSKEFWLILTGAAVGVGLAVILFYYRWDKHGTQLWLSRRTAAYLQTRTKATRSSFEAFALGIAAMVAELLFVATPIVMAANLALELNGVAQILSIVVYVLITLVPLIILFFFNHRGKRISTFIKWREKHKKFLQVMAGGILIMLGFYLLTYKVLGG